VSSTNRFALGCALLWLSGLPGCAPGAELALHDEADQQLCVDLVNEKRASVGKPLLARWPEGEARAAQEALEDGRARHPHSSFQHRMLTGPHGLAAQNECESTDTHVPTMIRTCINNMWAEGPERRDSLPHGHYNNMVNTDYTKLACGFAIQADGALWSVQDFFGELRGATESEQGPELEGSTDRSLHRGSAGLSEFDQVCLQKTNQFRFSLHRAPVAPWDAGASCAQTIAQAYARGRTPGPEDMACLGKQSWALSVCRSDGGTTLQQLEGCIGRAVREGPGLPSDPDHADYAYLASPEFHQAACGYFLDRQGLTTIVRIFR